MKVFAPKLTEDAAKIVDDAVKTAELELLGWTAEEAGQGWGQACLGFDHGGHDMQPRSSDRYLLYLAAWLESMDDDEDAPSACNNKSIERITRKSVLEHPLLAPRLDEIYEKARTQNPTLPSTLEKFVNGTLDGERDSALIVNGRVKWQKALFDGLHDTRAKAWQRTARKRDADRAKEMAGEWILAEPPWWTNFQRPCWQVAMRLRYGLEVNPAIGPNISPYCL